MLSRPSILKIENPKTIKILSKEKSFSLLQPFSLDPCSINKAAEQLNISISSYSYWIKQFLKHSLIILAYEEKRAGSNIKYYWMAADKLIIDLRNKPEMLQNYYLQLLKTANFQTTSSIASIVNNLDIKLQIDITPNKNANLYSKLVSNKANLQLSMRQEFSKKDMPAIVAACRDLGLSQKDAKTLQKEIWALLDKYQAKTKTNHKKYHFTITLAPAED